jgi:hypothetical protein
VSPVDTNKIILAITLAGTLMMISISACSTCDIQLIATHEWSPVDVDVDEYPKSSNA